VAAAGRPGPRPDGPCAGGRHLATRMSPRTAAASITAFVFGLAAGAWRELSWWRAERLADEVGWKVITRNGERWLVRR
jgi:hypothetical protein